MLKENKIKAMNWLKETLKDIEEHERWGTKAEIEIMRTPLMGGDIIEFRLTATFDH